MPVVSLGPQQPGSFHFLGTLGCCIKKSSYVAGERCGKREAQPPPSCSSILADVPDMSDATLDVLAWLSANTMWSRTELS